ncbi:hypothetical protein CVT25_000837 [Psilocybe cyanescens]|uniref:Uncharacterized protein n=1 Tax=Psilocybe cyanescens TaxID=93625 RepID=A0A409XS34_PSICY|nr:hypothetical protein CVT25_000837 [Psilocybe cyanescens]
MATKKAGFESWFPSFLALLAIPPHPSRLGPQKKNMKTKESMPWIAGHHPPPPLHYYPLLPNYAPQFVFLTSHINLAQFSTWDVIHNPTQYWANNIVQPTNQPACLPTIDYGVRIRGYGSLFSYSLLYRFVLLSFPLSYLPSIAPRPLIFGHESTSHPFILSSLIPTAHAMSFKPIHSVLSHPTQSNSNQLNLRSPFPFLRRFQFQFQIVP